MGLFGVIAGGVAGWVLSRRTVPRAVQRIDHAGGDADAGPHEAVIDLRDSEVVRMLQAELRTAHVRIEQLEAENEQLEEAVRRKDQAVAEARNTLESVRDSLAEDQRTGRTGSAALKKKLGIKDEAATDFPPDDGFGDLNKRLRAVTGELAEVTRRYRDDP